MQRGIWEYNAEADGGRWHYIIVEGITYAINGCYIDWDGDVQKWSQNEMGQWPFGNRLTEEEVLIREVEDVLFGLECYLEADLEWMDSLDDDAESDDDDSDDDSTTEDEDFDQYDYWALGLNSFLWRIDLYKEGQDGFWTL